MRTLMGLVIAVLLASAPLTHAAGMPQEVDTRRRRSRR